MAVRYGSRCPVFFHINVSFHIEIGSYEFEFGRFEFEFGKKMPVFNLRQYRLPAAGCCFTAPLILKIEGVPEYDYRGQSLPPQDREVFSLSRGSSPSLQAVARVLRTECFFFYAEALRSLHGSDLAVYSYCCSFFRPVFFQGSAPKAFGAYKGAAPQHQSLFQVALWEVVMDCFVAKKHNPLLICAL